MIVERNQSLLYVRKLLKNPRGLMYIYYTGIVIVEFTW